MEDAALLLPRGVEIDNLRTAHPTICTFIRMKCLNGTSLCDDIGISHRLWNQLLSSHYASRVSTVQVPEYLDGARIFGS